MKRTLRRGAGRGFSLIEVLIAVLVLSLGLLGLGMVFPVVMRQQRQAQDSIQGVTALRSASEYMARRLDLITDPAAKSGTTPPNKLWEASKKLATITKVSVGCDVWTVADSKANSPLGINFSTGDVTVTDGAKTATIAVSDRLFPTPFATSTGPQFVWDFTVRRANADRYQVALFVRRVDPAIPLPAPSGASRPTLSNILTGIGYGGSPSRSPVAVGSTGAQKGMPTFNGGDEQGRPNYAGLRVIKAGGIKASIGPAGGGGVPDIATRKWLKLQPEASDANLIRLARQPGQKLIDNRGNVHTVLRLADDDANAVILEQPLPLDVYTDIRKNEKERPVNFVFTPQVPAAAGVLNFNVNQ